MRSLPARRSLVLAIFAAALATHAPPDRAAARDESAAPPRSDHLQWFTDARFGMFIHWGPVSIMGTEIGWSRGAQVPVEKYDELYREFNPVEFDAAEWVGVAKAAGMKYLVITAKHHDGFCLWDSAHTDYDIMSTPWKRDVLAELSAECRKQDIRFCVYYSILDWHHPDYPTDSPGGKGRKLSPSMDRYFQYVKDQLAEIINNYGPLGVLWFDGQWEEPWTNEYCDALYAYCKQLQPDLIINNRVGKGRAGTAGTTNQAADNPGDYDTPEQRVGAFNRDRPWETCMTLCRQWAWKPNDQMKSFQQCVRTLINTAGGDGNLLFNVGPMPDGRIEPRQVQRLQQMGNWLVKCGDAIYGTRGGPLKPGRWGASTCRDDSIFLFIMNWPEQGNLRLPDIGAEIVDVRTISGGKAELERTEAGVSIALPEEDRHAVATVIELKIDSAAFDIEPLDVPAPPSGSVAFKKPATASNVFRNMTEYGPDMALDDDPETRWATDAGTKSAWLVVDLEEPTTISRAVIVEGEWDRVREFELEIDLGKSWTTITRGRLLGERRELSFPAVTARRVRLNILKATEGPTIWEFQLFRR